MAFINLAGTLLDPNSEFAVGDKIRFTHKSTTGETIQGAVSVLTIPPDGMYDIDLQFGLVLVEYKDVRKSQFENRGVATVNGTNPATSIPELLNALVPVSSAELIEFQAILADCVTAQVAAELARDEAEFSALVGVIPFDTVTEYENHPTLLSVGRIVYLKDRGAKFEVIAGTGTANNLDIIASTSVNQSIDYIIKNNEAFASHLGVLATDTDTSAALKRLFELGVNARVDVESNINTVFTTSASDINIIFDKFLVVDWQAVGANDLIAITGDNVKTKLKAKALDAAYVLANKVALQNKYVFDFQGDESSCEYGRTENNPCFVKSTKSDASFDFCYNSGFSIVTGLVNDTVDIVMYHANDGEKCKTIGNRGYGFSNGILYGLSTNNSTATNNIFWDCGNHCVYASSGDNNTVTDNIAIGLHTDIKARGDNNNLSNNKTFGGTITITNRVVDTGNGYALNSAILKGCQVVAERDLSQPISVSFRSGFDGKAQGVIIDDNTVEIKSASITTAVKALFQTLDDSSVKSTHVTGLPTTSDVFRIGSTAGIDPAECARLAVDGNSCKEGAGSALQLNGSRCTISSNNFKVAGGTGSNSGCVLGFLDESIISLNTLESTGVGISTIRQKTGDYNTISTNFCKNQLGASQIISDGVNNVETPNILR
jgi:hypothetical protein